MRANLNHFFRRFLRSLISLTVVLTMVLKAYFSSLRLHLARRKSGHRRWKKIGAPPFQLNWVCLWRRTDVWSQRLEVT
jgi:hypothetical protein